MSHEDALLPDWDRDWRKYAALDARLQELIVQHTDADPRWGDTLLALSDDVDPPTRCPKRSRGSAATSRTWSSTCTAARPRRSKP